MGGTEARVADLEIKADGTREAINALGEKVAGRQRQTREQFATFRKEIAELRQETRDNFRSVEEHFAEIGDLVINGRG